MRYAYLPYAKFHLGRFRISKFFNEAESLDDARLPDWMQTPVMRQAMNTLTAFSEQDRAYHAYLATPCLQWAHHSHRHLRFLSAAR